MAAKKVKSKNNPQGTPKQAFATNHLETHKYIGDSEVGVVYGDRQIHNSLEWQNSTNLYLQQVLKNRFFIQKAVEVVSTSKWDTQSIA